MYNCNMTHDDYAVIIEARPFPVGNPEAGVKFTLRGLTDEEVALSVMRVDREKDYAVIRAADRQVILYALGIPTRLGHEGWDYPDPPSEELIKRLRPEVVARLSAAVMRLTFPGQNEVKN